MVLQINFFEVQANHELHMKKLLNKYLTLLYYLLLTNSGPSRKSICN